MCLLAIELLVYNHDILCVKHDLMWIEVFFTFDLQYMKISLQSLTTCQPQVSFLHHIKDFACADIVIAYQ